MNLCDQVQILGAPFILSLMYDRYTKLPSWRNLAKRPTPQRGSRPNVQMRAAEGPRARRDMADARGRGRAGVWQERTAQNSGRIFALDGAWGAKVGLGPPKTDAIFSLEEFFKTQSRSVRGLTTEPTRALHQLPGTEPTRALHRAPMCPLLTQRG